MKVLLRDGGSCQHANAIDSMLSRLRKRRQVRTVCRDCDAFVTIKRNGRGLVRAYGPDDAG